MLIYVLLVILLIGSNLWVYNYIKNHNRKSGSNMGIIITAAIFEVVIIYLWLY